MDSQDIFCKSAVDASWELCIGLNCWQLILKVVMIGPLDTIRYQNRQQFETTLIDLGLVIAIPSLSKLDVHCVVCGILDVKNSYSNRCSCEKPKLVSRLLNGWHYLMLLRSLLTIPIVYGKYFQ